VVASLACTQAEITVCAFAVFGANDTNIPNAATATVAPNIFLIPVVPFFAIHARGAQPAKLAQHCSIDGIAAG
jgi:hypothetical protein